MPCDPSCIRGTTRGEGSFGHSSALYNTGICQSVATATDEGRHGGFRNRPYPSFKEVSAYTGDGVEELFAQLARIILTKIELGEIDPDDPLSGIQYGDSAGWTDHGSVTDANTAGSGAARGVKRPKAWQPMEYGDARMAGDIPTRQHQQQKRRLLLSYKPAYWSC